MRSVGYDFGIRDSLLGGRSMNKTRQRAISCMFGVMVVQAFTAIPAEESKSALPGKNRIKNGLLWIKHHPARVLATAVFIGCIAYSLFLQNKLQAHSNELVVCRKRVNKLEKFIEEKFNPYNSLIKNIAKKANEVEAQNNHG